MAEAGRGPRSVAQTEDWRSGAMETIAVRTGSRVEVVDVTGQVQDAVSRSGVKSGVVVVCTAHTTAGMTINENADPDVMDDVLDTLGRLGPKSGGYAHAEGNSDALELTVTVGGGIPTIWILAIVIALVASMAVIYMIWKERRDTTDE